jgi:hypothetical protein
MLNSEKMLQLQSTLEALPQALELILCNTDNSEFSRKLGSFVEEVCRISGGKLKAVEGGREEDLPASPCFRIRNCESRKIIYAAVPEGHQFAPFLKAMKIMAHHPGQSRSTLSEVVEPIPPEIWVLVSANCPHCPSAVEAAIAASSQIPLTSLFIIDAEQFPNLTEEKGIRTVPATVIDRRLVLIGNVYADRITELLRIRRTDQFDVELMHSLIDAGNIERAVEQFRGGKGRAAILSLLQEPALSSRMGALMVLERTLESDPASVCAIVPSLITLLSHQDSRIRGDVADVLGKAGDRRAVPALERLARDLDSDVAEAASEALLHLRTKTS